MRAGLDVKREESMRPVRLGWSRGVVGCGEGEGDEKECEEAGVGAAEGTAEAAADAAALAAK